MINMYLNELNRLSECDAKVERFVNEIADNLAGGKIVLTGVGKNALIAEMVYEFMLPFNIDCAVLDPHRAAHGNLGLIKNGDTLIMSSKSGNTEELLWLMNMIRRKGISKLNIYLITSNSEGLLMKYEEITSLIVPELQEYSRFLHSPQNTVLSYLLILMTLVSRFAKGLAMTEKDYLLNHQSGEIGKSLEKVS